MVGWKTHAELSTIICWAFHCWIYFVLFVWQEIKSSGNFGYLIRFLWFINDFFLVFWLLLLSFFFFLPFDLSGFFLFCFVLKFIKKIKMEEWVEVWSTSLNQLWDWKVLKLLSYRVWRNLSSAHHLIPYKELLSQSCLYVSKNFFVNFMGSNLKPCHQVFGQVLEIQVCRSILKIIADLMLPS